MEDTLRGYHIRARHNHQRLNPCFNGRYSQSKSRFLVLVVRDGLNPCFNGRYSQSHIVNVKMNERAYSLNPCFNGRYSQSS